MSAVTFEYAAPVFGAWTDGVESAFREAIAQNQGSARRIFERMQEGPFRKDVEEQMYGVRRDALALKHVQSRLAREPKAPKAPTERAPLHTVDADELESLGQVVQAHVFSNETIPQRIRELAKETTKVADAVWALANDDAAPMFMSGELIDAFQGLGKVGNKFSDVSDDFVNVYFGMLQKNDARDAHVCDATDITQYVSHDTNVFLGISDDAPLTGLVGDAVRHVLSLGKRTVLIPIHVPGIYSECPHWFLVEFATVEHRMRVYDSAPAHIQNMDAFREERTAALTVLRGALSALDPAWDAPPNIQNVPKQNNLTDCGVAAAYFAECILQNKPIAPRIQSGDLRRRMTLAIALEKL